MTSPQMARLDEHLQRLRLNTVRERLEALLQEASEKELSYADFLDGLPAAPAAALLFEDPLGGLGERGNAVRAALLQEGVAAGAGQLAVGEGQIAGLGERDERGGAESEFAAAAADDEPLDPASGPAGLDEEVQAVPVCVSSWRGVADEGCREGLVGMASSALGSFTGMGWIKAARTRTGCLQSSGGARASAAG